MIAGIDHEHLVEAVGQVLGQTHIVDRLPHRPERWHGNEIGLHDAAGGVLRIFEAAFQRGALERRQLGEDVRLLFLVEVLDDIDRFVGIELLKRLRHLFGGHHFEHLVAHRLVELRQRRGIEVGPERGDQRAALFGAEQLDEIGEVGRVQRKRQLSYARRVAIVDRSGDGVQELRADSTLFVAQFDLARGVLHGLSDRQGLASNGKGRGDPRQREDGPWPASGLPTDKRGSGATRRRLSRNFQPKNGRYEESGAVERNRTSTG